MPRVYKPVRITLSSVSYPAHSLTSSPLCALFSFAGKGRRRAAGPSGWSQGEYSAKLVRYQEEDKVEQVAAVQSRSAGHRRGTAEGWTRVRCERQKVTLPSALDAFDIQLAVRGATLDDDAWSRLRTATAGITDDAARGSSSTSRGWSSRMGSCLNSIAVRGQQQWLCSPHTASSLLQRCYPQD